ncbi:SdrD B-like domain-containing protein [Pontibacter sp. G13]|uniref:SdrD B-like domain-containing protein n=1 Tax=Pontibacter sp. G13 TaxID=3074898 RepID=UPI00288AB9AF|nr:SdrD B-like domain-containing protein [Pontibacter sp. G13]WNJ19678.1 SdrD B-like domain-containing protein [Pontibacter sp. G13]
MTFSHVTRLRLLSPLLVILSCFSTVQAQTPQIRWVSTFGAEDGRRSGDAIRDFVVDQAGNAYTLGTHSDTLDIDPGPGVVNLFPSNSRAPYLQKLDDQGNFVWALNYPDETNLSLTSLQLDIYDNLIIVGSCSDTVDLDPDPVSTATVYPGGFWILRLTKDGDFKSVIQFEGGYTGARVFQNAQGDLTVAGAIRDSLDLDPGAGVVKRFASDEAIFITQIDTFGNFNWGEMIASTGSVTFRDIAQDDQGNLITIGFLLGTADIDLTGGVSSITSGTPNTYYSYMAKYDPNGNLLWGYPWTVINGNMANLATDSYGNIYTLGATQYTFDAEFGPGVTDIVGLHPNNASEPIFAKYDPNGTLLRTGIIGYGAANGNSISESDLYVVNDTNIVMLGKGSGTYDVDPSAGVTNFSSTTWQQSLILEFDDTLGFRKGSLLGTNPDDFAAKLGYNSTGDLWVAGYFGSPTSLDPFSNDFDLTHTSSYDIFVAKLAPPIDSDNDGTPDNEDGCPKDPNKTEPGDCGCGIADTDADNNDIADCNESYDPTKAHIVTFVWDDQNGNGKQEANEPGIAGAVVKLLDNNDQKIKQTTTDANGYAAFYDLADAMYVKLQYVAPANHGKATADQGSNDNIDSDASTYNGMTPTFQTVAGQFIKKFDAGFFAPGTVEAFVWDDRNGNGKQDAGEPGIPGAVVKLLNLAGNKLKQVSTDSTGLATLTNVPADQLVKLQFITPANHGKAAIDQGSNDNIDSDANATNGETLLFSATRGSQVYTKYDAGFFAPGTVYAFVWDDQNGNGKQDAGEPGIPNAVVKLLDIAGNKLKQVSTNAKGDATLTNVPADIQVMLQFVKPANHGVAPANQGSNDNIDSDASKSTGNTVSFVATMGSQEFLKYDAGFFAPGTVEAFVWDDQNGNGKQEANEPGIGGAVVKLLDNLNQKIKQVSTDPKGYAVITNVPAGELVKLQFVKPANHGRAPVNQGSNDNIDSDANNSQGITSAFIASKGSQLIEKFDAGFFSPGTVEAFVWDDLNGNGKQDGGEPAIPGVVVKLLNNANQKLKQASTDAFGVATLNNVPADIQVRLQFVQPANHGKATANAGSNDNIDSDAYTSDGRTISFIADRGAQVHTKWDAAFYAPGTVETFVWDDLNGNGKQDLGEPGVQGAVVKLLNTSNQKIKQTSTDANGIATLSNVPADIKVKLEYVLPNNYTRTTQGAGSNANIDSDANVYNGQTALFQVAKGSEWITAWDAGLLSASSARQAAATAQEINLEIYPNPATDRVMVEVEIQTSGAGVYRIVDMQGRTVLASSIDLQAGTNRIKIDLSQISAAGTYYLNLISKDGMKTELFQIAR